MRAKKGQRITFRVSQPHLIELRKAAKEEKRTLSDWIVLRLAEALQSRQSKEVSA